MNKNLADALRRDFPILYEDTLVHYAGQDLPTSFTSYGFEIGNGWEPIVRGLSARIEEWNLKSPVPIRIRQIKEKFGGLRFYVSGGPQHLLEAIDEAEQKSFLVCEDCGLYDKDKLQVETKGDGWVRTLCPRCRELWNQTRNSL